MSDLGSEKKHPAWHTHHASKKHHDFVQALHDKAHEAATERNTAHEKAMADLRSTSDTDKPTN